jgi:hypothetical protein
VGTAYNDSAEFFSKIDNIKMFFVDNVLHVFRPFKSKRMGYVEGEGEKRKQFRKPTNMLEDKLRMRCKYFCATVLTGFRWFR